MSKIYTSADQLIGHTPLLELTHIENAENLEAKILAKLEYFNPAGSVKDRIARAMIDDADAEHRHAGIVQFFHSFRAQQQLRAGILILHFVLLVTFPLS